MNNVIRLQRKEFVFETTTLRVPYEVIEDGVAAALESYGYLRPGETIKEVDLGLELTNDGTVELDVTLEYEHVIE